MKHVLTAFLILASGLLGIGKAAEGRDVETGQPIELSTRRFCVRIGADGKCDTLIDLRDGKDYLADKRAPFATLIRGGQTHGASAVRREGDVLHISFGASGVSAMVRASEKPEWITFEVVGLSDERDVEQLTFLQIRLDLPNPRHAAHLHRVRNDRFAVSCQELNMQTEAAAQPLRGGDTRLLGRCYGRFGLKGAAVALMAVPPEDFLRVIEAMELAEGLPHPTLDGVWAKQSPAARTS